MRVSGFDKFGQLDELLPPTALLVARQPPDIRAFRIIVWS